MSMTSFTAIRGPLPGWSSRLINVVTGPFSPCVVTRTRPEPVAVSALPGRLRAFRAFSSSHASAAVGSRSNRSRSASILGAGRIYFSSGFPPQAAVTLPGTMRLNHRLTPWHRVHGRSPHRWWPQAPPWPGQVCGWSSEGMPGPGQFTMRLFQRRYGGSRRRRACRSLMGEPTVTAPERDVLLATKLHMPAPRPGLVPRPRLLARLDEGLARGLVLVCGPAGYGKTVLLADWARRGSGRLRGCRWTRGTTTRAGSGATRWPRWTGPAPGTGDRVAPLLGPPAPASFQGLVTALINELAAPDEALLVLDDYHVIGSPQVHESLAFLLEHRPAGICVVLASRSDPPLPLARLRARGQLTEIRVAELRFTRGGGRGAAPVRGVGLAGCVGGGAGGPDRGLGGRVAAGRAVTARAGRCRCFRGRVHREPPVRPGLPGRGSARGAGRAAADVPARDLGAGAAQRPAVRRRHRPPGQPGAARAGGTGRAVRGPAG